MKKQLHFITIILLLAGTFTGWAQIGSQEGKYYVVRDTVDGELNIRYYESKIAYEKLSVLKKERIGKLEDQKVALENRSRKRLAILVEKINTGEGIYEDFTEEQKQVEKEKLATTYAERINFINRYLDQRIRFEKTNAEFFDDEDSQFVADFNDGVEISFKRKRRRRQQYIGTTSGLSLAFGYNYIDGNNLDINDFSFPNNNYFSVGYKFKTTISPKEHFRLIYGVEYQTQGTELNANRAFSISSPDNTRIEQLNFNADKAKFRQDQLVFPAHLEWRGVNRKEYEDGRIRYDDSDHIKIGIGGYAGFNLSSRLKYKYELEGNDIKQTTVNAFDTNAFIYGLDAYAGVGNFTIFGRMGLNDIFKAGSVDGQYVAFGIRFQ